MSRNVPNILSQYYGRSSSISRENNSFNLRVIKGGGDIDVENEHERE